MRPGACRQQVPPPGRRPARGRLSPARPEARAGSAGRRAATASPRCSAPASACRPGRASRSHLTVWQLRRREGVRLRLPAAIGHHYRHSTPPSLIEGPSPLGSALSPPSRCPRSLALTSVSPIGPRLVSSRFPLGLAALVSRRSKLRLPRRFSLAGERGMTRERIGGGAAGGRGDLGLTAAGRRGRAGRGWPARGAAPERGPGRAWHPPAAGPRGVTAPLCLKLSPSAWAQPSREGRSAACRHTDPRSRAPGSRPGFPRGAEAGQVFCGRRRLGPRAVAVCGRSWLAGHAFRPPCAPLALLCSEGPA